MLDVTKLADMIGAGGSVDSTLKGVADMLRNLACSADEGVSVTPETFEVLADSIEGARNSLATCVR